MARPSSRLVPRGFSQKTGFPSAMLANAIGHLGAMIYKRSYFPGGVTATLLLPVSLYLIWQLTQL
jgi:hypothetical protein